MNAVTEVMDELRKALAFVDQLGAARDKAEVELRELQRSTSEALAQAVEWKRERDEAIEARDQYLRERDQARLAEERARESLDELDEAIYDCLPSDDDGDAPLDCVEHAADKLRALAQERDEARAEVATAYRRGAEAMREEAIQACLRVSRSESYYAPNVGDECADAVRALPIPEET